MKNIHDDLGYWAGWIAAFGITAAFFIFAVCQGSSLRDAVCALDESDCFRQWLSALGGWAAVGAAVPSIMYLSRQIRATDHQHRMSTALSLYRNRALAEHVRAYCNVTTSNVNALLQDSPTQFNSAKGALQFIQIIEKSMFEGRLKDFEDEVEMPPVSLLLLRAQLEALKSMLSQSVNNADLEQQTITYLNPWLSVVMTYLQNAEAAAERYLSRTHHFALDFAKISHPANASST